MAIKPLTRTALVSLTLTAVVLAACSASPGGSAPTPGSASTDSGTSTDAARPVTAAPGQLALRIDGARQVRSNGIAEKLYIAVTLANGAGGQAVALNPLYFKLKVASGLLKSPSLFASAGESEWLDGKLPSATDSLAEGASFERWLLAFDVDAQSDAPVALQFEVPGAVAGGTTIGDGRKAVAPVAVEACTPCAGRDAGVLPDGGSGGRSPDVCTYVDRDTNHCGQCGKFSATATCRGGVFACSEARETLCVSGDRVSCNDLQTDSRNCGACGKEAGENQQCNGGALVCSSTDYVACGTGCVDKDFRSRENCGSCGNVCGSSLRCEYRSSEARNGCRGAVELGFDGLVGKSCDAICAAQGGACSEAEPLNYICGGQPGFGPPASCGLVVSAGGTTAAGETCTHDPSQRTVSCTCGG